MGWKLGLKPTGALTEIVTEISKNPYLAHFRRTSF